MWLSGEATMSLTSPKKSFKPDPRLPNPEDITAGHITDVVHLEKVLKTIWPVSSSVTTATCAWGLGMRHIVDFFMQEGLAWKCPCYTWRPSPYLSIAHCASVLFISLSQQHAQFPIYPRKPQIQYFSPSVRDPHML